MKDRDKERLYNLTDKKDYGIFSPATDAQVAFNELINFFLGEDWYVADPLGVEQINTVALYQIEEIYENCIKRKRQVRK